VRNILSHNWWGVVKYSRTFVLLTMLGVLAVFMCSPLDISDTAFDETDRPLTASYAVLPQARVAPDTVTSRRFLSNEFRHSFEMPRRAATYGKKQDQRPARSSPRLQELLCVFLI